MSLVLDMMCWSCLKDTEYDVSSRCLEIKIWAQERSPGVDTLASCWCQGYRRSYGNILRAVRWESREGNERNKTVQRNEMGLWNRGEVNGGHFHGDWGVLGPKEENPSTNYKGDQILPPPRYSSPHCIFRGDGFLMRACPITFTSLREEDEEDGWAESSSFLLHTSKEHLPTKPYKSAAWTNIRRKSNILVYGCLTSEAWSI